MPHPGVKIGPGSTDCYAGRALSALAQAWHLAATTSKGHKETSARHLEDQASETGHVTKHENGLLKLFLQWENTWPGIFPL